MRTCKHCGTQLPVDAHPHQRYCSVKCRNRSNKAAFLAKRALDMSEPVIDDELPDVQEESLLPDPFGDPDCIAEAVRAADALLRAGATTVIIRRDGFVRAAYVHESLRGGMERVK